MNAESEREDKAPRLVAICVKKAIKLLLIYSSNTLVVAQSIACSQHVLPPTPIPIPPHVQRNAQHAWLVWHRARARSRHKKPAAFIMRPAREHMLTSRSILSIAKPPRHGSRLS